jgi:hypothetical protein
MDKLYEEGETKRKLILEHNKKFRENVKSTIDEIPEEDLIIEGEGVQSYPYDSDNELEYSGAGICGDCNEKNYRYILNSGKVYCYECLKYNGPILWYNNIDNKL